VREVLNDDFARVLFLRREKSVFIGREPPPKPEIVFANPLKIKKSGKASVHCAFFLPTDLNTTNHT